MKIPEHASTLVKGVRRTARHGRPLAGPPLLLIGVLLNLLTWTGSNAQAVLMRSTLGAGGGSAVVHGSSGSNYMQQAVGQASVAGSHLSDGRYFNQGFVQPIRAARVSTTNDLEARVFPNPFSDRFTVTLTEVPASTVRIRLFSATGQLLLDRDMAPDRSLSVNTGELASGSYIIRVDVGDRRYLGHLQSIH